jgi:hypothetical protein
VTTYFKFRKHVLADLSPEILPLEKIAGIICKFDFARKVRGLFFV